MFLYTKKKKVVYGIAKDLRVSSPPTIFISHPFLHGLDTFFCFGKYEHIAIILHGLVLDFFYKVLHKKKTSFVTCSSIEETNIFILFFSSTFFGRYGNINWAGIQKFKLPSIDQGGV